MTSFYILKVAFYIDRTVVFHNPFIVLFMYMGIYLLCFASKTYHYLNMVMSDNNIVSLLNYFSYIPRYYICKHCYFGKVCLGEWPSSSYIYYFFPYIFFSPSQFYSTKNHSFYKTCINIMSYLLIEK